MYSSRSCKATIFMSPSLGQEAHKPGATPNTGDGPVKSKVFQCGVAKAKMCKTMLDVLLFNSDHQFMDFIGVCS